MRRPQQPDRQEAAKGLSRSTGAVFEVTGKPATEATIKVGKPAGLSIGKIAGSRPHRLSVTVPLADLPSFTAAVQGPRPILLDATVTEGDSSVGRFRVISDDF